MIISFHNNPKGSSYLKEHIETKTITVDSRAMAKKIDEYRESTILFDGGYIWPEEMKEDEVLQQAYPTLLASKMFTDIGGRLIIHLNWSELLATMDIKDKQYIAKYIGGCFETEELEVAIVKNENFVSLRKDLLSLSRKIAGAYSQGDFSAGNDLSSILSILKMLDQERDITYLQIQEGERYVS